jgi:hypothetical protein
MAGRWIAITGPVTLCAHAASTTPGAITYCWQGPNSASGACLPTVNPGVNDSCITVTQPGTYYISASHNGGCTVLDSVVVLDSIDIIPPTITCPANTTIDCPTAVTWGMQRPPIMQIKTWTLRWSARLPAEAVLPFIPVFSVQQMTVVTLQPAALRSLFAI